MSKKLKALVILGNGFDLNQGIKSSYDDFFSFLEKEGNSFEVRSNINFKDLSCWPFIFKFNNSTTGTWQDIEKNIYDFFKVYIKEKKHSTEENEDKLNLEYLNLDTFKYFANLIDGDCSDSNIIDAGKYDWITENAKKFNEIELDAKELVRNILRQLKLFKKGFNGIDKVDISNIEGHLLDELNTLERKFSSYMIEQIKYPEYNTKSLNMVKNLITLNNQKDLHTFESVDILNFNYTSILKNEKNKVLEGRGTGIIFKERNIHGRAAKDDQCNIIFGIDSKNLKVTSPGYRFSKTYRVINNHISKSLSDYIKIEKNYDYIYFYGLSLGEQDYSYFQSIFDTINLYNSKTVLRFMYTEYYPKEEEKKNLSLKMNTAENVSKLITTYGESFEQEKIKGQNLLHRLILENRIEIIEIDPNKD